MMEEWRSPQPRFFAALRMTVGEKEWQNGFFPRLRMTEGNLDSRFCGNDLAREACKKRLFLFGG